jgi:hypothetical protein
MLAVVIATALGTIGAGSIIGFDVAKTALLAAIMAVAVVSEDLARAFIADGKLSEEEINAVFSKAAVDPDGDAPVALAPVAEAPVAEASTDEAPVQLTLGK